MKLASLELQERTAKGGKEIKHSDSKQSGAKATLDTSSQGALDSLYW